MYALRQALTKMWRVLGQELFSENFVGMSFRLDSVKAPIGGGQYYASDYYGGGSPVIVLHPTFITRSKEGGYRDIWSPIIHEMWHAFDDWASEQVYGEENPIYVSTNIYHPNVAQDFPHCGQVSCPPSYWNSLPWEDRVYEDFAVLATDMTNKLTGDVVTGMTYSSQDQAKMQWLNGFIQDVKRYLR